MQHRLLVALAPEQRLVGHAFVGHAFVGQASALTGHKGQQVDTVEFAICGHLGPGGGGRSVKHVHMVYRRRQHAARLDARGPARHEGHVGAALEVIQFPAAIGTVDLRQADITGAAVVAGKNHQGVLAQAIVLERLQYPADAAVQGANHAGVYPQGVVCNMREGVIVLPLRLQRIVHRPVRQVEEKGPVAVGLYHLDGFIGVVVCQVPVRRKGLAAIEGRRIAGCRPHHLVNVILFAFGVHHIRVVLRQEQRARQIQAVVKALPLGHHITHRAQVPLADMGGVITRLLQYLGHRYFTRRHTQLGNFPHSGRFLAIDKYWQRRRVEIAHPLENGGANLEKRRELETEAGGIATGHQRGPGRGADRVGRIAVLEHHTLAGDGIDMGRHQAAVGGATVVQRDVVETHIIGQYQDDIGRPLPRWPLAGGGALRPVDRHIRAHRAQHGTDNGQAPHQDVDAVVPGQGCAYGQHE